MKTYIIAEIGVNHNGSLELAKKMVREVKKTGANAAKFQTFIPEKLVTSYAKQAEYQTENTGKDQGQKELLEKLALSYDDFRELKALCDDLEIDFLSTPFDLDSIDFLESLNMKAFKIPSGEYDNIPYLEKIGALNVPIILSSGLSDLNDVENGYKTLMKAGCDKANITILHCNTDYPTPMNDVHLKAMVMMGEYFEVPIGYSDHTLGMEVPIAAVAMGAQVIEKHFTLDKEMEGPDHLVSLDSIEFTKMVESIRNIENALGKPEKKLTPSALKNKSVVQKSIVASQAIVKGEVMSPENLTIKRPGGGVSPLKWHQIINQVATKNYLKDEYIDEI